MISRERIKLDLLGQIIIASALVLMILLQWSGWSIGIAILLIVWQLASAIHLAYAYRYIRKLNFVKTVLVIAISTPLWISKIGLLAWLPVVGLGAWYLYATIRDTIIIYNRPRSFWDL